MAGSLFTREHGMKGEFMSVLEMIKKDLEEQGLAQEEIQIVLNQFIDLGNYAYK